MSKFVNKALMALVAGVFVTSIYAADESANMSAQPQSQANPAALAESAAAPANDANQAAPTQANAAPSDPAKADGSMMEKKGEKKEGKGKKKCHWVKKCDENGKHCKHHKVCKHKGETMSEANPQQQDAQQDNAAAAQPANS